MPHLIRKVQMFICLSCGTVTDTLDLRVDDCCNRPVYDPLPDFGYIFISERMQEFQREREESVPVVKVLIQEEEELDSRVLYRTVH